MAKERLSLYFDTDVEIERKMWEYICKDGKNRKSYNVKKALEILIEGIEVKPVVIEKPKVKIESDAVKSDTIQTSDDNDLSDDEIPF